nr:hypothetical protein Iba_scaffold1866CG0430 [Ipomoea batatas]
MVVALIPYLVLHQDTKFVRSQLVVGTLNVDNFERQKRK